MLSRISILLILSLLNTLGAPFPVAFWKQPPEPVASSGTQPANPAVSYRFDDLILTNYGTGGSTYYGDPSAVGSHVIASGQVSDSVTAIGDGYWYLSTSAAVVSSNWSCAFWLHLDGVTNIGSIIVSDTKTVDDGCGNPVEVGSFIIDYGTDNKLTFGILNSVGTRFNVTTTDTLSTNEWHHIACTYNFTSGAMKIYRNGTIIRDTLQMASQTPNFGASGMAIFGVYNDDFTAMLTSYAAGKCDAMQIWPAMELTQDNVTYLYNSGTGREYVSGAWTP